MKGGRLGTQTWLWCTIFILNSFDFIYVCMEWILLVMGLDVTSYYNLSPFLLMWSFYIPIQYIVYDGTAAFLYDELTELTCFINTCATFTLIYMKSSLDCTSCNLCTVHAPFMHPFIILFLIFHLLSWWLFNYFSLCTLWGIGLFLFFSLVFDW